MVEACIYKAKWGIKEHINLLKEQGLPVQPKNPNPKIIVQNEEKMVAACLKRFLFLKGEEGEMRGEC